MRRRLQFALMAIGTAATLLSFTPCLLATDGPITVSTDDSGHKVYVNDFVPPAPQQTYHSEGK